MLSLNKWQVVCLIALGVVSLWQYMTLVGNDDVTPRGTQMDDRETIGGVHEAALREGSSPSLAVIVPFRTTDSRIQRRCQVHGRNGLTYSDVRHQEKMPNGSNVMQPRMGTE